CNQRYGDEKVTTPATAKVRHAERADPKYGAGLGPGRDFQVFFTVEGFDLDLGPESRLGKRYWNGCVKISTLTLELRVFLYVNYHNQVAGRAAVYPSLAFA